MHDLTLTSDQLAHLAARICLGLVFLTSGLGKLRDLRGFRTGVRAYNLFPASLIAPIALLVPLTECILALLLLADVATAPAAVMSAGLFLAFSIAVAINLRRGRTIACHCHGVLGSDRISWGLLARNALLLLLCGLLFGHPTGVIAAALTPMEILMTSLLVGWCLLC